MRRKNKLFTLVPKLAKFRLKMASLSEDLVDFQTQDLVIAEQVDGLSIDNLVSIYDEGVADFIKS